MAAETYYEGMGQNWERAAMIKARAGAGDLAAGATFLGRLRPFVWRKHLDFAAIQDIHSIIRQIHAVRGYRDIAVAGHNIKLGHGGIRAIEFFAQTQQLIWGGRDPSLRQPATCDAIEALVVAGHVPPGNAADLIAAYGYLRTVEHRLQMIEDHQTQTLPTAADEIDDFACFLGHASTAEFSAQQARPHFPKILTEQLLWVTSKYLPISAVGKEIAPVTVEGKKALLGAFQEIGQARLIGAQALFAGA